MAAVSRLRLWRLSGGYGGYGGYPAGYGGYPGYGYGQGYGYNGYGYRCSAIPLPEWLRGGLARCRIGSVIAGNDGHRHNTGEGIRRSAARSARCLAEWPASSNC